MPPAAVGTSRGQPAGAGLTPTFPHSFTRYPHATARARPQIEDACGATTTNFLYLILGEVLS